MRHKIVMALDLQNNKILETMHINSSLIGAENSKIHCEIYLTGEGRLVACSVLEGHDFITVIPSDLDELLKDEQFTIESGGPNNYSWRDYKKNIIDGNKVLIDELATYQLENRIAVEEIIPILHNLCSRVNYYGAIFK